MAVLVTGGAGYVGSHVVQSLLEHGEEVIVIDNFCTGSEKLLMTEKCCNGDMRDEAFLVDVFSNHDIKSVIHLASNSLVGESMEDPLKYYDNNVVGMITLLKVMKRFGVRKIVLSSSAAVYEEPDVVPILESNIKKPNNTYGDTKLVMETLLERMSDVGEIDYVALRYFNAAGAHKNGKIGERHDPETHLIPLVLKAFQENKKVYIYGDDYDTEDGTCVRDYIHVMDLAEAHYLGYKYLEEGKGSEVFNLGSGMGYSVYEVINAAERVVGKTIEKEVVARRNGDPAVLIASSEKAERLLGWKKCHASIEEMIRDAWHWHRSIQGQ